MNDSNKVERLKEIIKNEVLIRNSEAQIDTLSDPQAWILDFRRVLMQGEVSDLVSDIFYEAFAKEYPFQLGTLEIGGVPLVTSILNKFYARGHRDVNAFFVRKSRKKSGLMQMIEGVLTEQKKIILVDDTMNSGNSFWRQIVALEDLGYRVDTVWSIVRYRDESFYTRFNNRGIKVKSLLTLDDLSTVIGPDIKNLVNRDDLALRTPFTVKWRFKSEKPSFSYVLPKSQPCLDGDLLFVGSDNETFYALRQSDGSVVWSFRVGRHTKKKSIFSSPVVYEDLVIFGSYDGNIYALDKQTGVKRWVSFEADWVGSSPAVAFNLGLVFIGVEFGLFRKQGGIIALDVKTGQQKWSDCTHQALTHASPTYLENYQQVVIGSNEGVVRLYDARSGELIWKFTTFGGATYSPEKNGGFSDGEIKQATAYDSKRDYVIFGATDGFLYILERSTGHLVHHTRCNFAIWGTPTVCEDAVYFTSLDKRLRCLELDHFTVVFDRELDGTRIFSSPACIDGRLYVGTNAGRLHELDAKTGMSLGYLQVTERITNTLIRNAQTGSFFLPTFANEVYCLERESSIN